jgi:hypothetical protein
VFLSTACENFRYYSKQLPTFYNTNLPECNDVILEAELKMWHKHYSNEKVQEFHQKLQLMPLISVITVLSEYFHPAKIFATLPITTSTSERSFSTSWRTITHLRKAAGRDRLTGLTLLNIQTQTEVQNKS